VIAADGNRGIRRQNPFRILIGDMRKHGVLRSNRQWRHNNRSGSNSSRRITIRRICRESVLSGHTWRTVRVSCKSTNCVRATVNSVNKSAYVLVRFAPFSNACEHNTESTRHMHVRHYQSRNKRYRSLKLNVPIGSHAFVRPFRNELHKNVGVNLYACDEYE